MVILITSVLSIAISILILNLYGIFICHYPINIIPQNQQQHHVFGRYVRLQDLSQLTRYSAETEQDYVTRLNILIGGYMIHYLPSKSNPVPWHYNYILRLLQFTGLKYFQFYEFYRGTRGLSKGYGFCSQIAIILWYYSKIADIETQVVRLSGHVINRVTFKNGNSWLIDADYQVIIDCTLLEIQNNPSILSQYYQVSNENLHQLMGIFAKDHTTLSTLNMNCRLLFEDISFILKWVLPIATIWLSSKYLLA